MPVLRMTVGLIQLRDHISQEQALLALKVASLIKVTTAARWAITNTVSIQLMRSNIKRGVDPHTSPSPLILAQSAQQTTRTST